MLTRGVLLGDRYRLDERVATGGMGAVWRGTDVLLEREVAVKVLLPSLVADPEFTTRFRAEARMLAALRHPGVVAVHDVGQAVLADGGRVDYLVMEYVDGEPLGGWIGRAGRLDAASTMSVVAQAADALHAAHLAGIVHRDVKPGNLLVKPDGRVVLVDFGIARSRAMAGLTAANMVLGTASYMSPEQAAGQPVSSAADVYALGAVAYFCLAGQPPFVGENPLEVALRHVQDEPAPLPPGTPPAVVELVARAMAKSPADRFGSAAELARAAAEARDATLATIPVSARPPWALAGPAPAGPPVAAGLDHVPAPAAASPPPATGTPGGPVSPAAPRPGGPVSPAAPPVAAPSTRAPGGFRAPVSYSTGSAPVAAAAQRDAATPTARPATMDGPGPAGHPGGMPPWAPAGPVDTREDPRTGAPAGRRRGPLVGAAVVVLVAVVATVAVLATRGGDEPDRTAPALAGESTQAPQAPPAPEPEATTSGGGPAATPSGTRPAPSATGGTPGRPSEPAGGAPSTGPTGGTSARPTPTTSSAKPGKPNPYTAAQVCGSGYQVIDSATLTSGGQRTGRVYLLYHAGTGTNCVVTLKDTAVGTRTAVSAYLEVQGKARTTDSGSFDYYAGPVRARAAGVCVRWGGAAGGDSYGSPFEHCD
ncbi:protein kinase [Micromonospora krabiensis]|uniref:non-specific serine/threonine protein kinase n=1 Tax=Micromonospora krabiensis TaxID=307121 RepID=A0A1C3NCV1_9ACTN|nr:serine/threonine protein kinase [Micromonospora krabiensis]